MCEFCLMEHMCCNLVCRTDVGYVLFCGFLLAGYWYLSQSLLSRNQLYAKIYFPYLTTLSIGRGNYSCSSGGSITYQGREIDLFHREATQNGHIFPHRLVAAVGFSKVEEKLLTHVDREENHQTSVFYVIEYCALPVVSV